LEQLHIQQLGFILSHCGKVLLSSLHIDNGWQFKTS
jgi:hypothetical protein